MEYKYWKVSIKYLVYKVFPYFLTVKISKTILKARGKECCVSYIVKDYYNFPILKRICSYYLLVNNITTNNVNMT